MNITTCRYDQGFVVRATIPKSVKSNTRKSVKTWKVKCLRPELSATELKFHLRAQIDEWARKKLKYFEQVTGKPSTLLGVEHEP